MGALSFLDKERTIAPPGYSRWLIPPAALAIHLCIGQAYATSVYKQALVAHFDTSLTAVGVIFSIAMVMLGASAAAFGTWVERVGPRRTMFTAACCWSSGFLVAALGIWSGQLWLVYLGYGVIGGIGLGLGYISPVSTLIKWFPDRPGLATGMAIMGFGGGAMVAAPASRALLAWFGGEKPGGEAVMKLFLVMGVSFFVIMMMGVFTVRVPAPGWQPSGFDPSASAPKAMVTSEQVSARNAVRTPQFWLLWVVLLCNVTAGIGILEQAAAMIQDFFRDPASGVSAVSVTVAAGFVGLLSLANMGGRFLWSTASDHIGRRRTYLIFLGVGIGLYLTLATIGSTSTALFVLVCAVIISYYGGGFATAPAYLRDLFGTHQVGAIHGRLLTAWSTAGILGPLIVNRVLDSRGTPGQLVAADYRPALSIMVGVLALGFVANLLIRPVAEKWHERDSLTDQAEAAATDSPGTGGTIRPATGTLHEKAQRLELLVNWAVVSLPLAYGLFHAVTAALKLFHG